VPTYQYVCTECATPLEVVQTFTDPALTECPTCGGRLRKVFSAVGVVFKGSGFYRNDSREKVAAGASKSGDAKAENKTDGKSEKKTEGKGEGKTDAKPGQSAKGQNGSGSAGSSSGGAGATGDRSSSTATGSSSGTPKSTGSSRS
jgi:putative FmdB family regulatory protein